MNFAYLATDEVTGLNRSGVAPELTGQCTPQQLTYGMVAEYYTAPNGVLAGKSQNEVNTIEAQAKKDAAVVTQTAAIEARKGEENLKPFPYGGNSYVADKSSIQATQNECLASDANANILTLRGTTHEGSWAVVNGFVPYTCGEFIVFATEFFKRGSDNFTVRSTHLMAIDALYNDANKTAQDILDYDYSTGWH